MSSRRFFLIFHIYFLKILLLLYDKEMAMNDNNNVISGRVIQITSHVLQVGELEPRQVRQPSILGWSISGRKQAQNTEVLTSGLVPFPKLSWPSLTKREAPLFPSNLLMVQHWVTSMNRHKNTNCSWLVCLRSHD